MANIAPSWTQVHPSFVEPGLLIQYNQKSGAFQTLAGGNPLVKIGAEDKYVYMKSVKLQTKVTIGQQAANQLPSASTVFTMASTPAYLQRLRAEYDHHDTAAVGRWGTSIVDAQRLAMRQGHFQILRNNLLYGVNGALGEGLLNANGATAVSLPADSQGDDTVVTYDDGEMAFFILQQILDIKTRTMTLGIPRRFVILGPQRVLGLFEYNVVQLTSYIRQGAGSNSTAGTVKDVADWNGDKIEWVYDDTLIGKGSGGTDAVLIVMPEVEYASGSLPNTNEFAELEPGILACTLMYSDVAAPIEIPTPLAGGAIDVVSEMTATSGWAPRPEGVTIVSMQYQ